MVGRMGPARLSFKAQGSIKPIGGSGIRAQGQKRVVRPSGIYEGGHQNPPHPAPTPSRLNVDMAQSPHRAIHRAIVDIGVTIESAHADYCALDRGDEQHLPRPVKAVQSTAVFFHQPLNQPKAFRLALCGQVMDG